MRSKPRRKTVEQLSYKNNWKTCSTAKTKVRLPRPFLRRSCASRLRKSNNEVSFRLGTGTDSLVPQSRDAPQNIVSGCRAFSCPAVGPSGEDDFRHLALADDAALPFVVDDAARSSADCGTFGSSHEPREQDLRALPFCQRAL